MRSFQQNIDKPCGELTPQALKEFCQSDSVNHAIDSYRKSKQQMAEAKENGESDKFLSTVCESQAYQFWLATEKKKDERRKRKRFPMDKLKLVSLYVEQMKSTLPAIIPTANFTESADRWGRKGKWRVQ